MKNLDSLLHHQQHQPSIHQFQHHKQMLIFNSFKNTRYRSSLWESVRYNFIWLKHFLSLPPHQIPYMLYIIKSSSHHTYARPKTPRIPQHHQMLLFNPISLMILQFTTKHNKKKLQVVKKKKKQGKNRDDGLNDHNQSNNTTHFQRVCSMKSK